MTQQRSELGLGTTIWGGEGGSDLDKCGSGQRQTMASPMRLRQQRGGTSIETSV
jgi:hypothetical protein